MSRQFTNYDEIIGNNLRVMRIAKGLSQSEVGKILRVSYQQIQKYERGASRLSASTMFVLSNLFKIPVSDFFSGLDRLDADSSFFAECSDRDIEDLQKIISLPPKKRKVLSEMVEVLTDDTEDGA